MVGANPGANTGPADAGQLNCGTGLAAPGESRTYNLYTPHEGAFVINSYGATLGSEANSGNLGIGMFGALNVEPQGARIYRSQVTEEELRLATVGTTGRRRGRTAVRTRRPAHHQLRGHVPEQPRPGRSRARPACRYSTC